jgi:hypothetical protein
VRARGKHLGRAEERKRVGRNGRVRRATQVRFCVEGAGGSEACGYVGLAARWVMRGRWR